MWVATQDQPRSASGIETPTRADRARMDRQRKKKGSNDDWTHPHDPDAKITMKDGRTHLAHKAEHVGPFTIDMVAHSSNSLQKV